MADILEFRRDSATSGDDPQALLEPPSSSSIAVVTDDAAARARALDPQRSFLVEAPAGSGKTGLLMQRFLTLLGDPATGSPEEVLAITFMRKATAELRERILQQLEDAAASTPLPNPEMMFARKTRELANKVLARDRQLGWNLLTQPRRLRIQTIDSLCMEIAGSLPLLSGAATQTPATDPSELYRQAARRTLRWLGGTDEALHEALRAVLLHRDGNLADVETLLAEMLQTREQWAELVPLDRESLHDDFLDQQVRLRLERTLERIVCAGLTRALKLIPATALTKLAAFAHRYSEDALYNGKEYPIRLCREHPGPPAAEAAHLDHWRALLSLLLTNESDWRKVFSINIIGFKADEKDKDTLRHIVAEIQSEPLRQALEEVRCLPPARYPDDQWHQAKALFRLLLHALAELKVLFAEKGECDFTEFSLAARSVLAHAGDLAGKAGTAFRHLLVDEMQDTSSAQYDLLTALTRSWDGSSQTVFLVGDPKQSIFLFRQARVERFLYTAHAGVLGDVPLHSLQLTANFRSRPALVDGVNEDFARLFAPPGQPSPGDTADVPFVAATATRGPDNMADVHWHTRTLPSQSGQAAGEKHDFGIVPTTPGALGPARSSLGGLPLGTGSGTAFDRPADLHLVAAAAVQPSPQEEDAAAIRRIVERWRARPLPAARQATATQPAQPWRIAVLANARRHLAPIVTEFRRSDDGRVPIPYRAVKVEPLEHRAEVLDAFALTRALHHAADRAAWFAVLRAPWCGLDAADLLTLAAEGEQARGEWTVPQLVARRSSELSVAGRERLQRAWPVLQTSLEGGPRTSLATAVERTWRSLGGDLWLGRSERSNVERYFSLVREAENRGALNLAGLKRRLKELYADSGEAADAVELMTIHGAKGLEWDVVLVPELGRQGQRERSRLLNWLEWASGSEPAVLLAPIQPRGDKPGPLYRWLSDVYARRLEAERKRLFYVACTRAREELHLFATAKAGKTQIETTPGSLLHACWPAAERHFTENAAADSSTVTLPRGSGGEPSGKRDVSSDEWRDDAPPGLALAAAAEQPRSHPSTAAQGNRFLPKLTRLPLHVDLLARFHAAAAHRLPYILAAELHAGDLPIRPEGSAAVRALGNVVHRFLEQIAAQLTRRSPADLQAELPTWLDRLTASLRSEGLAPSEAARQAGHSLALLAGTLADPVGVWLLSPHAEAASERPIATPEGMLRVDRTFLAGPEPGAAGTDTIWVVDFKTTRHGGRSPIDFAEQQRATYGAQLARYAKALRGAAGNTNARVELGLYFPAIPYFLHWPAEEATPTLPYRGRA